MRAWEKLRPLFDTDDGSLPEVRLTGIGPGGVVGVFGYIRSRAVLNPDATFWHRSPGREETIAAAPDPAGLVAAGEADAFHVLASGLTIGGTVLPDLGVFVFPDEVALDYRMGTGWGEAEMLALFELLRQLTAFAPGAGVVLEPFVRPEVEALFVSEWEAYCRDSLT